MSLLRTVERLSKRLQEFATRDNVRVVVTREDGSIRKQFNPNALGMAILRWARAMCSNPYDNSGIRTTDHIRKGILPKLAVFGLVIPMITGLHLNHFEFKNGVTDAGRAAISSRINGSGAAAAFTSIGMGTGVTGFNAADTALETGVLADGTGDSGVHVLASGSVTVSLQTTTITDDTARLVGTVAITATIAVTESGIFNANTAGTMLARQTFSAVNVVTSDSLQLQWDIKNA